MSWQQNLNLSQHLPSPTTDRFTAPQLIPPSEIYVASFQNGGSHDMAVDGTTPVNFRVTCPADKVIILSMGEWHIADGGIEPNTFGGLAALTNGVAISVHDSDDTTLVSWDAVKSNILWSHLGAVNVNTIWQGATTDMISVRWEMTVSIGYSVYLTEGQYVQTKVQDNLSTLDHFEGTMHGRIIDA